MRNAIRFASSAAVALLACSADRAVAADLPMEAPPAVVAVDSFTWSGFYLGGAVGYAFSDLKVKNNRLGDNFRFKGDVDSVVGSGFAGVNYQFGAAVVGAEADVSYANFGSKSRTCPAGSGFTCRASADDWFGTIRGRVGYAFDRVLVFGTGGLAVGQDVTFRRTQSALPAAFNFGKDSSGTRYGYALGAGVDYAVTDNVFVRGEYQYVDFGKEKLNSRNGFGGGQPAQIDQDAHLIRAGVAYKF